MQIGNYRNLRRLTDGLEQELADFARMRIGGRFRRHNNQCGRVVIVLVVILTATVGMHVHRIGGDMRPVVMVLILRRQQMQTLAQ